MVDFRAVIDKLHAIHFYDVLLPFILIYAVVFAILEKSKIFNVSGGENENSHVRNINSIIAFVFGLFAVASLQTVLYIQSLIINIVLVIIFILVVLILFGFIFGEDYKQLFMEKKNGEWHIKSWAAWTIGLVVLTISLLILASVTGVLNIIIDYFNNMKVSDDVTTFIIIIAIGFIIYWVSKEPKKGTNSSSSK